MTLSDIADLVTVIVGVFAIGPLWGWLISRSRAVPLVLSLQKMGAENYFLVHIYNPNEIHVDIEYIVQAVVEPDHDDAKQFICNDYIFSQEPRNPAGDTIFRPLKALETLTINDIKRVDLNHVVLIEVVYKGSQSWFKSSRRYALDRVAGKVIALVPSSPYFGYVRYFFGYYVTYRERRLKLVKMRPPRSQGY